MTLDKISWKYLTPDEQNCFREKYRTLKDGNFVDWVLAECLEEKFGKDVLNSKPIKTWDDLIASLPDSGEYSSNKFDNYILVRNVIPCPELLKRKLEAAYRIAMLIDAAYGGIITEDEWNNVECKKYAILYRPYSKELFIKDVWQKKYFFAFHTKKLAEEFLSNMENKKLALDYYQVKSEDAASEK